jgi:hypothetical protein
LSALIRAARSIAFGLFGSVLPALAVKPRRAIGFCFFFPHPQATARV